MSYNVRIWQITTDFAVIAPRNLAFFGIRGHGLKQPVSFCGNWDQENADKFNEYISEILHLYQLK